MKYLIVTVGTLITCAGIVLLLRPSFLFDLLRKYRNSSALYGLAVIVRVVIGIALIITAPATRFPLTLGILGWVAMAAAIFIGAMGRTRFSQLLTWVLDLTEGWGRVSGLLAISFGSFLVYAAL